MTQEKKLEQLNKVGEYLYQKDLHSYQTIFHEPTKTCTEAKEVYDSYKKTLMQRGIDDYALVKSILYTDKTGSKYFLCLTLSDKKIDSKDVKKALNLNCKLPVATDNQVVDVLDVVPGNVSIFSLINDLDSKITGVYVDPDIYKYEVCAVIPNCNEVTMFFDTNIIDTVIKSHQIKFYDTLFSPLFEDGNEVKVYKKVM